MLDLSNCWSQETADDFDWTLDATPSGGTGPSDDFTGGGNYMMKHLFQELTEMLLLCTLKLLILVD